MKDDKKTTGKQLQPRLRFKGFTDPWEQRQLGSVYHPSKERNDPIQFRGDRIISVANMHFAPKDARDDYLKTYNIFRIGDIAFEGHKNDSFEFGRFVENDIGEGIVSHVFSVYRPYDHSQNIQFWKYLINNENVMRRVLRFSTISATMMRNLVPSDFEKRSIAVPNKDEQQQIGKFLSELDSLIAAAERKCGLLKLKKQAYLQQMFPQNGEKQPRLRFRGFTADWQSHPVSDFLVESRIKTVNHSSADKLTVKLWGKGVVKKEDGSSSSTSTQFYRRKAGQFIYGKLDFLHAAFGIIPEQLDGCLSTLDVPAFDFKGDVNHSFLLISCLRKDFYLKNGYRANGSRKAKRINQDTFLNMSIQTPSVDEQNAIADFSHSLDKRIALASQYCEALKQLKQGYLQQMFV